jgi:non-specific protein-tyrosine kinase
MAIDSFQPAPPDDNVWIGQYLGVLRRRKWTIIIFTILGVLGAGAFTKVQDPVYESTARVQATQGLNVSGTAPQVDMATETSFVSSDVVTKCASLILEDQAFITDPTASVDTATLCAPDKVAAIQLNRRLASRLDVGIVPQSTILTIGYTDSRQIQARAKAQAFALSYVYNRTAQAEDQLAKLRKPIEDQKTKVDRDLQRVESQIDRITNSNPTSQEQFQQDQQKLANLRIQQQSLLSQQTAYQQQLLNLDASKISPPQILLPAQVPLKPISPDLLVNLAIGFALGLLLGVIVAFIRERLDDSLRGRHDLEVTSGAPVLAVIPKIPGWRNKHEVKLIVRDQPKGGIAEAYRTLRTGVSFLAATRGLKVIMVASPGAGEGKTATAANLGLILADAGKRVVLVSADLRKPRLHRFFGMENTTGLSPVLSGDAQPWEAILDPQIENLRILLSGPVPARPAELLQSEAMGEVIAGLKEVADFVILDTAPVLLVADALALSPFVDGCLLVADAEHTTRGAVAHAREQLEQVGTPIVGSVLNNFDPSKAKAYPSYGYYSAPSYRYGYGSTANGESRSARPELETPRDPRA